MKGLKKCISAVTAAAMVLTALPVQGTELTANAAGDTVAVDATVKVHPEDSSTFNDTDGDGLGEFEGWGTSLCWWANRLGYDETLTQEAARVFYSDEGLDLNIGRYNVGGGDNVGEVPRVEKNEKATVYDLTSDALVQPFEGTSMEVAETNEVKKLQTATYTKQDADFGFNAGDEVGLCKEIGWISPLGEKSSDGKGGNLKYNINVNEATTYTIKMLCTLNGTNKRAMAIRVTAGGASEDYVVDRQTINSNLVAAKDGENMFLVTFDNVALANGENQIAIGGNEQAAGDGGESWGLNFVKMLVVKTSEKGVLPGSDFLHAEHAKRSDSMVPGYWKDVTKLPAGYTDAQKQAYEQEHDFARVDWECGYAWNYDWDADHNQMAILKAASEASGEDFIAEAFSNSPPYFMTVSGCCTGNTDASKDNLRADSYKAFAAYMADVIVHWAENGVIFQSATAMNEPFTNYWGAYSWKQEGCHFDQGNSESKIIVEFKKALEQKKADASSDDAKSMIDNIILSGTDETDIDIAISSYQKLSTAAKKAISRIDTHTYGGSKRAELRELAEKEGKNLWMSEIDGNVTAGTDAGEMSAALGFAQRIMLDMNGLKSSAWIMWDAIDVHIDADDPWDLDDMQDLMTATRPSYDDSKEPQYFDRNGGYWGIAFCNHDTKEIILTKKYDAYGQFSRYIRPGYTIMGTSDAANTLVAYDPEGKKAVIVAVNTAGTDKTWKFDLSRFAQMGSTVKAYRTSGEKVGSNGNGTNGTDNTPVVEEVWADVSSSAGITADTANKSFTAAMKANSITTFIVEGVEFDKEASDNAAEQEKLLAEMKQEFMEDIDVSGLDSAALSEAEITLNNNMLSGSDPWKDDNGSDGGHTVDKVIDGDYDTFFDALTNGYVQIDLGEGNAKAISAFGYAPRSGYEYRCPNAQLYGSNDGKAWTLIYTITETPESGKLTYAYINQFTTESINQPYRYYKYTNAVLESNIAEIKLYGIPAGFTIPPIPDTAAKWAEYCENKTTGRQFTEETYSAYETALTAAKASGATDEKMYDLFKAYFALKELYNYQTFTGTNGDTLYDTKGDVIQAHGGQVQWIDMEYDVDGDGTKEDGFWYWIGEDKTNDYRPCPGVHAYISKDLLNWVDIGCVLKTVDNWNTFTTDKYFTDLYGDLSETEKFNVYKDIWTADNSSGAGCVIERPKMLYNEKTGKYVIWFHADGQVPNSTGDDGTEGGTSNYAKAKAGIAVSDSPFGPFKLQGTYMLAGVPDQEQGFAEESGHVRDMNLFKDDDGTAYVMYSSEGNAVMYIAKLNEDYTGLVKDADKMVLDTDFCISSTDSREAPAMFKYNNKYYLITSGCSGWTPNQAAYAVADSPLGPWTRKGDPCVGDTGKNTFLTQSTCVIPVDAAAGKFIYMGDRWANIKTDSSESPGAISNQSLRHSRYVWLPIEFRSDGTIAIKDYKDWPLTELDNKVITDIEGGNKTYYVDSKDGDDSADGTTPETAWKTLKKASTIINLKAGGGILLKSGSVWDGEQLTVKGANGTKENPVIIGSYGDGEKPLINGKGAGWDAATKEELATVHIYNSQNIVIENLAITNWDESAGGDYKQSAKLLSGLVVENRDAGKLSNVTIRNNKIYNVNGLMRGGAEKAAGGLIVVVTGNGANHTGVTESYYDGLTISGNEVTNVCHEAIYMESVWAARKLVGGKSADSNVDGWGPYQNAGDSKWVGSRNVKIDNNYVHDVAGDGIVPINTTDAIVEYNLIHNSADCRWDYSANPNHAALWAWDANNVIFRYNEACHTSMESKGTMLTKANDSMAFDFDYGVQNCVYEYNYSHDNLGGFLMLCPGPGATVNNIARYNVSVNDGLYDGAPIIRMGTGKYGSLGVQIYNNTIYWKDSGYTAKLMPHSAWGGPVIDGVEVCNNIFCGPAEEGSVTSAGITYHNNAVSGGAELVYQPVDENAITGDPKFVDVKDYTEGSWANGKTTLGTADGFKIAKDSSCIDKGAAFPATPSTDITVDYTSFDWSDYTSHYTACGAQDKEDLKAELVQNTTTAPVTDYYGNSLKDGKVDIGAHEGSAEPAAVTVDKTALQNLYDTASAIKVDGYTADSYQNLQVALGNAKVVLDKASATQAEVDGQVTALQAAVNGLKKVESNGNGNGSETKVAVSGITIKAPSKKLAAGKTIKLTVDVKPANATNKAVTWKVSNTKLASINQKTGSLKLKKTAAGKSITVTATAADGSGKKATLKIKVMKHAVKSVKVKAPAKTLKVNKTMKLKVTVKTTGKSVNKTLSWKSSNTKYATVSSSGKVKAKKAGKGKTVTITATSTDGSNKKSSVKIKIK